MSESVEVCCPVCGDEVYEWNRVEAFSDLYGAFIDDDGSIEPIYGGTTDYLEEASEIIGDGYACRSFCEGKTFPLGHFVEKEA